MTREKNIVYSRPPVLMLLFLFAVCNIAMLGVYMFVPQSVIPDLLRPFVGWIFLGVSVVILAVLTRVFVSPVIRSERDLRESEERLRLMADNTSAAIFIYRDKFLSANSVMEELTGYSAAELLGMHFHEVIHPTFFDVIKKRNEARQKGVPLPAWFEVQLKTKNGDDRWVEYTSKLIKYKGGPASIGTAYDVTDRKRKEQALFEVKNNKRASAQNIQAIPDMVIKLDKEKGIIDFKLSSYFKPFLSSGDLLGKKINEIFPMGAAVQFVSHIDEAVRTGTIQVFEYQLPVSEETRSYEARIVAGEQDSPLIIVRDITERKNIEAVWNRTILAMKIRNTCDGLMLRSGINSEALLREAVAMLAEKGGYRYAWAGLFPGTGGISFSAHSGTSADIFSSLLAEGEMLHRTGPVASVIQTGSPAVARDIDKNKEFVLLRSLAIKHGFDAMALLPLKTEGIVRGLLIVCSDGKTAFMSGETDALVGLADDIAWYADMHRPEAAVPRRGAPQSRGILVADPDPGVRDFFRNVLEQQGYFVVDAADGDDAVEKYVQHKNEVGLVISGILLEQKNGRDAYTEIRAMSPLVKILYAGAYPGDLVYKKKIIEEHAPFIMIPFSPEALLQKVREVLAQ